MLKKVFFLFIFLQTPFLKAQNPDELLGTWTEIIGQHKISEKWSIPTIVILQHYEPFDDFQFIILRSGLTYRVANNVSTSMGYDYLYSESFSGEDSNLRHRFWQELSLGSKYSSWNISHRYRLESTWTRQEPQYALSHRFRYRLKLDYPLYKKLYFTSLNEIYINLDKPYFNQNTLHLGLGYPIYPNLRVELGYFKNHFSRAHFDRIRLGIVFNTRFLAGD